MDANRLGYVSARSAQLQGLELLPLSLVALLKAAYDAGLFSLPGDHLKNVGVEWFLVAVVLAVAAAYPIRGWYLKHVGMAPPGIAKSQLWPLLAGVLALPLGAAIQPAIPFNGPVGLVALLIGAFGIRDYPFRRHYIAAAAVLFAYALHRFWVPAAAARVALDLSIAAALAIVGIGDHRLLVSTVPPVNVNEPEVAAHV